jgi:hypothetical protein
VSATRSQTGGSIKPDEARFGRRIKPSLLLAAQPRIYTLAQMAVTLRREE